MFEHIEQKDEAEASIRFEGSIECSDVNARAMATRRRYEAGIGLDSPDIAEPLQLIEEQAVAAPDVQDAAPSAWRGVFFNLMNELHLTGPPPPMLFVELAVTLGVFGIHLGDPVPTAATTSLPRRTASTT